jgi:hypothetical protein
VNLNDEADAVVASLLKEGNGPRRQGEHGGNRQGFVSLVSPYFLRALRVSVVILTVGMFGAVLLAAEGEKARRAASDKPVADKPVAGDKAAVVPDARQSGGEADGIVQVANLVYAGTKSSHCFADHFLIMAEKDSAISTSRRFHAVKLASDEIYEFPLVIMTGEGPFELSDHERENLRRYVERGGLVLASAGCSSQEWDHAFRREMARVFADHPLKAIDMSHPMFHTVYEINSLGSRQEHSRPLEGISIGNRLGIVYSQDGLNDAHNVEGCCCCGGSELSNAVQINVNILAYALTY